MYLYLCTSYHIIIHTYTYALCVAFLASHTHAFLLFYSLPSPVTELINSQVVNTDNFKK